MKRKLAFVVQRYGLEVNGGAELLSRQLVEHLQQQYDIEVLTTKAIEYTTWKNEYTNDVDVINGVTVRRFGVVNFQEKSSAIRSIPWSRKNSGLKCRDRMYRN